MVVHPHLHPHPSNRVLFVPTSSLGSSLSSALARHWSFAGAPFSVSFPIRFVSRVDGRSLAKELAARFDPSIFRSNAGALNHRATVPCQVILTWLPITEWHIRKVLIIYKFKYFGWSLKLKGSTVGQGMTYLERARLKHDLRKRPLVITLFTPFT